MAVGLFLCVLFSVRRFSFFLFLSLSSPSIPVVSHLRPPPPLSMTDVFSDRGAVIAAAKSAATPVPCATAKANALIPAASLISPRSSAVVCVVVYKAGLR